MFQELKPIALSEAQNVSERSIQDFIAEHPKALGLGSLIYIGRERTQKGGGRLDLLLSDEDGVDRYCVEVQLGKTDPSHIVRTIEYWDTERRKNRAYDHIAVIVAEDITNRFFNVVSILGNSVPIIALKLTATQTEERTALLFSKVLDTTDEYFSSYEDEEETLVTDRDYWNKRATKETVSIADQLLSLVRKIAPGAELNFNKYYIGIRIDGQSRNFVIFKPKKNFVTIEPKIGENQGTNDLIEHSGLETLEYDSRYGAYRIKIKPKEFESASETLLELLKKAYDERFS